MKNKITEYCFSKRCFLPLLALLLIQPVLAQSSFNVSVLSTTLLSAQNILANDIDSDGDLDIVSCGEKLIWWENNLTTTFNYEEHLISSNCGETITSRVGDIDNDGDIDIVASHYDRNVISLWLNDGNHSFSEHIVLEDFVGAHDAIITDINDDGLNDIVASRGDTNNNGEIVCLLQGNDGQFSLLSIYEGDFCHSIDIADFNNDGMLDIASTHVNQGVRVFINQENNSFSENLFNLPNAHFVRTCDFDNDGDSDVLCAALGFSILYLKNQGDGSFTRMYLSSDFALFLYPYDITGDGLMDIIFSDPATQKFKILENNGNDIFTKYALPGIKGGASGVFAADIDNDGDADLLTTCWNSNRQINIWENQSIVNSIEDDCKAVPADFNLEQNYPNPFNPKSNIMYQLSKPAKVNLKVLDLLGKEVATLVDEHKAAGNYMVEFNGTNLTSGIYFYKLQVEEKSTVRKMILLR